MAGFIRCWRRPKTSVCISSHSSSFASLAEYSSSPSSRRRHRPADSPSFLSPFFTRATLSSLSVCLSAGYFYQSVCPSVRLLVVRLRLSIGPRRAGAAGRLHEPLLPHLHDPPLHLPPVTPRAGGAVPSPARRRRRRAMRSGRGR